VGWIHFIIFKMFSLDIIVACVLCQSWQMWQSTVLNSIYSWEKVSIENVRQLQQHYFPGLLNSSTQKQ
jgi:hypothetical protein